MSEEEKDVMDKAADKTKDVVDNVKDFAEDTGGAVKEAASEMKDFVNPTGADKLPNAMPGFIFGAVAVATFAIFGIPGIIFGIIARKKVAKDQPLFDADPVKYKKEAWKLKLGKILGLVGIILGSIYFVVYLAGFIMAAAN